MHTLHACIIELSASVCCRAGEELAWARKAQEETGRRAEALAAAEARSEAASRDLDRQTAQLQVTVQTPEAAEGCHSASAQCALTHRNEELDILKGANNVLASLTSEDVYM